MPIATATSDTTTGTIPLRLGASVMRTAAPDEDDALVELLDAAEPVDVTGAAEPLPIEAWKKVEAADETTVAVELLEVSMYAWESTQ